MISFLVCGDRISPVDESILRLLIVSIPELCKFHKISALSFSRALG